MIPSRYALQFTRLLRPRFFSVSANSTGVDIPELKSSFSYLWLRDACQAPTSVHPSTRQKLFNTSDIPLDIQPIPGGVQVLANNDLHIQWADGHTSVFPETFLRNHADISGKPLVHNSGIDPDLWDNARISKTPSLFLEYDHIKTPLGLLAAIDHLCRYGLLFVRNVPNAETSSTGCELVNLGQRFSQLRETFYGVVWDVINLNVPNNIAYTNLNLGLHMDLLYFQHPPRYQILHCLVNKVEGGQSIFVDAFHTAKLLTTTEFEILATTPVSFHYKNDGHHLDYSHPTIETSSGGKIEFVNYSPPFQAPLPLHTPISFYASLRKYAGLLNREENTFRYTLEEGVAVIFDNRRILHARTAFTDRGQEPSRRPNRWLKGCYLEADALWDRGRVLRQQHANN